MHAWSSMNWYNYGQLLPAVHAVLSQLREDNGLSGLKGLGLLSRDKLLSYFCSPNECRELLPDIG